MKPDNLLIYHPFKIEDLFDIVFENQTLSSSAKLCYYFLHRNCTKDGSCSLSLQELSKLITVTPRQVIRIIKELEKEKFIYIKKSEGKQKLRHTPNTYFFIQHPSFKEYLKSALY